MRESDIPVRRTIRLANSFLAFGRLLVGPYVKFNEEHEVTRQKSAAEEC